MGCGTKLQFSASQSALSSTATTPTPAAMTLPPTTVITKKNQSVKFSLTSSDQLKAINALSFTSQSAASTLTGSGGSFQILDAGSLSLQYTPNSFYVGSDSAAVYGSDVAGNSFTAQITVTVGNTLNLMKAALVVRGIACITCHSNVSSNIITDYGFGSPWYFDTSTNDSFYFDRLNSGGSNGLATLNLLTKSKIVVPQANVPSAVQSEFKVTSLAEFIQARFAQGSTNTADQVSEISSLSIKIPNKSAIQEVFGNPTALQVYLLDTQNSPALDGLQYDAINNVFKITALTCDGDLYLAAPVVFENATVSSINGCRIYTTASIFIDTPVRSIAYKGSTNFNTQLLSTESIWMGTGRINRGGSFCEVDSSKNPTGWYSSSGDTGGVNCQLASNAASPMCDTLTMRAYQIQIRNTFSRAYPDSASLTGLLGTPINNSGTGIVLSERAQIEASLGHALYDASCTTTVGRNQAIARLMVVAPYINNRFTGDFSGATVAEAALMALGTFTYHFDPIFTSVSVFSQLDDDAIVAGQGL